MNNDVNYLPCKHRWTRSNIIRINRTEWIEYERCKRCDTTRETRFRTKIYNDGRTFTEMSRKNLRPNEITGSPTDGEQVVDNTQ